jgi:hypothetical protein
VYAQCARASCAAAARAIAKKAFIFGQTICAVGKVQAQRDLPSTLANQPFYMRPRALSSVLACRGRAGQLSHDVPRAAVLRDGRMDEDHAGKPAPTRAAELPRLRARGKPRGHVPVDEGGGRPKLRWRAHERLPLHRLSAVVPGPARVMAAPQRRDRLLTPRAWVRERGASSRRRARSAQDASDGAGRATAEK